jgi:uncharacterized membrane protein YkvA (DUF1232 family)
MAHHRQDEFSKEYTAERFWAKLLRYAKTAGAEVAERALMLFYALEEPRMPAWAKAVIIGALGYFIAPADAIPDFVPAAGYSDDLGVLVLALATVVVYITPEVKEKARAKVKEWFE